jgi:flagellar M-ring protein FliF
MELAGHENQTAGNLIPGEATPQAAGENLPPVLRGFMQMPRGRQLGFILTLAITLAVAAAILMWSQRPDYQRLFGTLPEKDAGEVVEALKKLNAEYKIDRGTGMILVPESQLHELRLKLATQGLPRADGGNGFELLDKSSGFGTSQMMETARYQQALEGEIARSIMSLRNVRAARVHLAMPKESVFVRQPRKPSASVVVDLGGRYGLEAEQVEGIVHLVAASVPQLEPSQVTVVDQLGHLLNSRESTSGMNLTSKQFDYKRLVEDHLIERVENILIPLLGRDGMRTQVSAEVDFTETERTQELFNPDAPALRSEHTSEEKNAQNAAQGIPGALSNQPPPAGVAPQTTAATPGQPGATTSTAAPATESANLNKSATRNYELDKTVSHTKLGIGQTRRVSVAVVVDHRKILQPDGTSLSQPWSEEDLSRYTNLVKEAVGFDVARGDRVTVTNAAFLAEPAAAQVKIWEEPWFASLLKQVGAGLLVIMLIFAVLRPAVRGLIQRDQDAQAPGVNPAGEADQLAALGATPMSAEALAEARAHGELSAPDVPEDLLLLEAPQSYEKRLEFAHKAIDQDPKRVAQVIKNWMGGGASG